MVIDEGLGAEDSVNRQQNSDIEAIYSDRIHVPVFSGAMLRLTLNKPQMIVNTLVYDRDLARHVFRCFSNGSCGDEFARSMLNLIIGPQIRDCEGRSICSGQNVISFFVKAEIDSEFMSEIVQILDDIGLPNRDMCNENETCVNLGINMGSNDDENPMPAWRWIKRWKVEAQLAQRYQVMRRPGGTEYVTVTVKDRSGHPIVNETLGTHATYGIHWDVDQYSYKLHPVSDSGYNEINILSGIEYMIVVNLGENSASDVGSISVDYRE